MQKKFSPDSFIGMHASHCFCPSWLSRTGTGYPYLSGSGNIGMVPAHRAAFQLFLGLLEPGQMVLHRCGDPGCINLWHLYIGNSQQNSRDRILHRDAQTRWGPLALHYHSEAGLHVSMRQPLAISWHVCRVADRFEGFDPSQCFTPNWLELTSDGYLQLPRTNALGVLAGAHRLAYSMYVGRLSKYDVVEQKCGNQLCICPFHLSITGRISQLDWAQRYDGRFKKIV